jgi:hypothetical protein
MWLKLMVHIRRHFIHGGFGYSIEGVPIYLRAARKEIFTTVRSPGRS